MKTAFAGKVAIVTGGAGEIGRQLCTQLAQHGGRVIVADIDGEGAKQVAQHTGGQPATLDVRDPAAVQQLVGQTAATHGRLDYLFNSAGISVIAEAQHLTPEHWQRVLDTNLLGVIHGIQAAYPLMIQQGHGHIINIASLAGLAPTPFSLPYVTSKTALVGLSAALRTEAAGLGIRVSLVCPGYVAHVIAATTEVVGLPPAAITANIPFRPISPAKAAAAILRGVARNRPHIIFPTYARLGWLLHRLNPALYTRLVEPVVARIRGWVAQR